MAHWTWYRDQALALPVEQGYHGRGVQWRRVPMCNHALQHLGPYWTGIGWWMGEPRRSDNTFKVGA